MAAMDLDPFRSALAWQLRLSHSFAGFYREMLGQRDVMNRDVMFSNLGIPSKCVFRRWRRTVFLRHKTAFVCFERISTPHITTYITSHHFVLMSCHSFTTSLDTLLAPSWFQPMHCLFSTWVSGQASVLSDLPGPLILRGIFKAQKRRGCCVRIVCSKHQ